MATVIVHHNESIDEALKRFKRMYRKDRIEEDYKSHRFFISKKARVRENRRKHEKS